MIRQGTGIERRVEISPDVLESDLRAILDLMGKTIASPGTLTDKRRAMLDGLLSLTGSCNWIWQVRGESGKVIFTVTSQDAGSRSLANEDLVTDEPFVLYRLPRCIIGLRRLETGETARIGMFREATSQPYGLREIHLIRMILEELPWLYLPSGGVGRRGNPVMRGRRNEVLRHMSRGRSRNEIADRMGLSLHTVSDHAKFIFAAYGVHSQSEFMSVFHKGTAGTLR